MNARFFAIAVAAASLAGCAAAPGSKPPGPAYVNEMNEGRPGMFGELKWDIDMSSGGRSARTA
jgi:hypothetical protein